MSSLGSTAFIAGHTASLMQHLHSLLGHRSSATHTIFYDGLEDVLYHWASGFEELSTLCFVPIPALPANVSPATCTAPAPVPESPVSPELHGAEDFLPKDKTPDLVQHTPLFLAVAPGNAVALFSLDGRLLGSYDVAGQKNQPSLHDTQGTNPLRLIRAPVPVVRKRRDEPARCPRRPFASHPLALPSLVDGLASQASLPPRSRSPSMGGVCRGAQLPPLAALARAPQHLLGCTVRLGKDRGGAVGCQPAPGPVPQVCWCAGA